MVNQILMHLSLFTKISDAAIDAEAGSQQMQLLKHLKILQKRLKFLICKKLDDDLKNLILAGQGAAAEAETGPERDRILDAVDKVKDAEKGLQDAAKAAAAAPPNDIATANQLNKAADKHDDDDALKDLQEAVVNKNPHVLENHINDVIDAFNKAADDVETKAVIGDKQGAKDALKDLEKAGENVVNALHGAAVNQPLDDDKKSAIEKANIVEKQLLKDPPANAASTNLIKDAENFIANTDPANEGHKYHRSLSQLATWFWI